MRPGKSVAAKLKALMDRHRLAPRPLSAAIDEIPDVKSVSHALISGLLNGSKPNPTTETILSLCEALKAPPAYLLPHESYDDLEALTAFEDPAARRIVRLLEGLPPSEVENVVADLQRRRDDLGLAPVVFAEDSGVQSKPAKRRSVDEAAQYAADALEG
ncbi:helix-turn-helix transcriptional regulator [Streptomyces diastatochromogenes]|nr:helix-turn-helix transcriptional regulator [Streptomyces diastatochromogenes]